MERPKNNEDKMKKPEIVTVSYQDLAEIVRQILLSTDLPKDQVQTVADCLLEAELCGVASHGVATLQTHVKKIESGGYNIKPTLRVMNEGAAFAVVDADNAIGFVSAVYCMEYAIKKSRQAGIFTVFSRNSNTYGSAFYYPLLAAKQGLIGITLCNGPPAMPVSGGKEKMLGTNPFAIAVPYGNEKYIIFDMATSKAAKSKINQARINHEDIPLDWALDDTGIPTTDPIKAINGLMLPFEGYKGCGLAMTIDILSGVLSGASFLNNVGKFYSQDDACMNVGQTFIAIDPLAIYGDQFYSTMANYVDRVHNSEAREGEAIRIPGENKLLFRQNNIKNGIRIDKSILENIKGLL